MGGMSTCGAGEYDFSRDRGTTSRSARDFSTADGRDFTGGKESQAPLAFGKNLTTDSPLAVILGVDCTGSMKTLPSKIFQKMATLYHEANAVLQSRRPDDLVGEKLPHTLEVAVLAIGDATVDKLPLQVVDFSKDAALVTGVNALIPEGGGGSTPQESYELAAYFALNHCKTPYCKKPLFILIGDEGFYDTIQPGHVWKHIGDTIKEPLAAQQVIKDLTARFDFYVLRPEQSWTPEIYSQVHAKWAAVVGTERTMKMTDPNRFVDCVIQICGYAAGNLEGSTEMLQRRQTPAQVKEVLATLHPLTDGKADKKKK